MSPLIIRRKPVTGSWSIGWAINRWVVINVHLGSYSNYLTYLHITISLKLS
jgi:hypothetical protein